MGSGSVSRTRPRPRSSDAPPRRTTSADEESTSWQPCRSGGAPAPCPAARWCGPSCASPRSGHAQADPRTPLRPTDHGQTDAAGGPGGIRRLSRGAGACSADVVVLEPLDVGLVEVAEADLEEAARALA